MVMNGFDTDGDSDNNFYTVNGRGVLLRQVPDSGEALRDGSDLPREPDRVRPHQLVSPARRLLPLLPDWLDRPVRVHRHRHVPGAARWSRSTSRTPATSCSMHIVRVRQLGWMGFFEVVDDLGMPPAAMTVCKPDAPRSDGIGLGCAWRLLGPRPDGPHRRLRLDLCLGGRLARRPQSAETHVADQFDIRRVEFKPGEIPHPRTQSAA